MKLKKHRIYRFIMDGYETSGPNKGRWIGFEWEGSIRKGDIDPNGTQILEIVIHGELKRVTE